MLTYQFALDGIKDRLDCDYTGQPITEQTAFSELGMDSLDFIAFLKEIEDDFSVSFPDDSLGDMETVGAVARAVVALKP